MKLKSMTSVITKSALVLAACASLNAFAGAPSAKAPVAPLPEEDGALYDSIGAAVEVGYDSRYYFRGQYRAENTLSSGLNLSNSLTEQVSVGFNAKYITTERDFSELDLTGSVNFDAGFATLGLAFTHYEYFDGYLGAAADSFQDVNIQKRKSARELNTSGAEELGLTAVTTLGPVNVSAGYYYNFTIGGSYSEVGASLPIEVTPWLSLVPAFTTGYGFDYYTSSDARKGGWTSVVPSISAPIKLTKSATLSPYVAYNISLDSRHDAANGTGLNGNGQDSDFFGGVRLSVSF